MSGNSDEAVIELDQEFETREEAVKYVKSQINIEIVNSLQFINSADEFPIIFNKIIEKWSHVRIRAKIKPYAGGVYLCHRPANIAGLSFIDHHWLKTDKYEAGMGAECPTPGQGCMDIPFTPVYTKDHSGQSEQVNASCELQPDVDVDCVNARIEPGRFLGLWMPLNECQSFASRVIYLCKVKR